MTSINAGGDLPGPGILTARGLVNWKKQQGLLKVPFPVSKVIISPQLKTVLAKQKFSTKKIRGLVGTHLCLHPAKGIYLSGGWGVGAPALIAVCEELHALGATEFYLAGVCGRLTQDIKEGDTVIAASAIREEGTSQHYLPTGAGKNLPCPDLNCLERLSQELSAKKTIFVSTDAPYRETLEKYNEWRACHASIVDMETAALYAFGNYYGIKTCSIAIGADSLADGKWTMAEEYPRVEKKLSELIDNLIEII